MRYASVVLKIPIDRAFSYAVSGQPGESIGVGKRVWVPFGKRRLVGYVVDVSDKSDVKDPRPIESVIDREAIISGELLALTKWISDYYICSWGEAIDAAIPGVLKRGRTSVRPRAPLRQKAFRRSSELVPTDEQKRALDAVKASLDGGRFNCFLLHGITASGKTEVYMQAMAHALSRGRSSIVLVPEISLTPQTVERFKARFGSKVAVMHSGLVGSKRFREYKRIREGAASIVVGARSAIFSPVRSLGLVIIDEEHETSYKQENAPRYHARETAIKRAELVNGTCILGSATPSMESYYNARQGAYRLLELTKRMKDVDLPKVNIIDMRKEFFGKQAATVFSRPLRESIESVLSKRQQAILFLNRRGYSTFINCTGCGNVLRCKRCDSVLVYHYSRKKAMCHYCNWATDPPSICPKCRGSYVKYFGTGTERVESEFHRHFPEALMDRMDTDTTKRRGSHDRILTDFKRHKSDVLVGTQMIAKGLDFPKVTLVGVISADTTLNLPDFRASERTFNLLTQVAGRAGRGKDGGRVLIQTYTPGHYAITTASRHDYRAFYDGEIRSRKDLGLPPFVGLIKVMLRSRKEEKVIEAANALAKAIKEALRPVKILGPAPAVISRVKNFYRWNIIVKTKDQAAAAARFKALLGGFKKPSGVIITLDVDPVSVG